MFLLYVAVFCYILLCVWTFCCQIFWHWTRGPEGGGRVGGGEWGGDEEKKTSSKTEQNIAKYNKI